MREYLKVALVALVAAFVGGLLAAAVVGGISQSPAKSAVGGYTEGYWDSADGYYVDGTAVIDGSGNFDGAVTSGSASSFAADVTMNAQTIHSDPYSTSSALTTLTIKESDLLYSTVLATLSGGATTWTLPASSTLTTLVPTAGDRTEVCFLPLTNTLSFTAGTGIDLLMASTTNTTLAKDVTISAGGLGCINFVRQADTDVTAALREFEDAD